MKKNINSIVVTNIASTILIKLIGLIVTPIVSRLLGAHDYGVISIYTTWVTIINVVFSLQTTGTFAIARNEMSYEEQARYQSSCLGLNLFSYSTFSVCAIFLNGFMPEQYRISNLLLVLAIIHAFGLNCINIINVRFTYEYKAKENLIISLISSIAISTLTIALILVLPVETRYYGKIYADVIFYAIAAIICIIYMYHIGNGCLIDKRNWLFCLKLSLPIVAHSLASIVMGNCDVLMIKHYLDYEIVGIYSLAATFSGILGTSIFGALNNSWIAFYFDYLKQQDEKILKEHVKNYMYLFLCLSAGFVLLSAPVYKVFAAKEFWGGEDYICFFVIGTFFSFLYTFPANYEFFCKNTKMLAVGTFLSSVINIVLNCVFIQEFGGLGAVIATAISNVFLFAFHQFIVVYVLREKDYPLRLKFFMPFLSIFLLFCFLYIVFLKNNTLVCFMIAISIGIFLLWRMRNKKTIM